MPDLFMIFVFLFLFLGVVGVAIAIIFMRKNQRNQKNAPIERTQAKVVSTQTVTKEGIQNETSRQIAGTYAYGGKGYYVRFKTIKNKHLSFQVKKKDWFGYHDGETGILTYQGYKLISFERKEIIEKEGYFDRVKTSNQIGWIYGEAKQLSFNVPSNQPKPVDIKSLERFIKDLIEDSSDWFFTLKNLNDELMQVERGNQSQIKMTRLDLDQEVTIESIDTCLVQVKMFFKSE